MVSPVLENVILVRTASLDDQVQIQSKHNTRFNDDTYRGIESSPRSFFYFFV
jgi:hypothetical protein